MNLYTIKASLNSVLRSLSKQPNEFLNILLSHRRWFRTGSKHNFTCVLDLPSCLIFHLVLKRNVTWALDLPPCLLLQLCRISSSAESPQLHVNKRAFLMYCRCDLLPGFDLFWAINARDITVATCFGSNEGSFSDKESTGDGGTLAVVLRNEWERDVVIVRAESSKGCHDDTVLQFDVTNLQRLEESA